MTEALWLVCDDAYPMVDHINSTISRRKLRLFGAACVRRVWHLLADARSEEMIAVAERHADGLAGDEELSVSAATASDVDNGSLDAGYYAAEAAARLGWDENDEYGSGYHVKFLWYDVSHTLGKRGNAWLIASLRDIAGNPFRLVVLAPAHRSTTVISLARAAYDERHFPSGELDPIRLRVLADALEETGAPSEVVSHLRSPGPHVRGCWAVDLCLGLS